MFFVDWLKKIFCAPEPKDVISNVPLYDVQPPKKENKIEFNVREIVTNSDDAALRLDNQSPLILCQDMSGTIQPAVSDKLDGYEVVEINTSSHPGPFNIFAGMKREELKEYERMLAPVMEQTVLSDLSRVLLHSVLLSMIEQDDLSWKKFTALISSAKREKPEYVATAIDDEICAAFKSFKDLTKNPEKVIKEFDRFKDKKFWEATQGIVQNNEKMIVFFRNYSDPVLNKFLEYKLRNV